MKCVAAVTEQDTLRIFLPDLPDNGGDACVASRLAVDCPATLPEQLLVQAKIGVAVVHLHNCQRVLTSHAAHPFLLSLKSIESLRDKRDRYLVPDYVLGLPIAVV
jgi:hypothetical protein